MKTEELTQLRLQLLAIYDGDVSKARQAEAYVLGGATPTTAVDRLASRMGAEFIEAEPSMAALEAQRDAAAEKVALNRAAADAKRDAMIEKANEGAAAEKADKPKSEPAAEAPVVDAGTGQPISGEVGGSDEVPTLDEVKAEAIKLTQLTGGNAALREFFTSIGVEKLSQVPAEQYGALLRHAKAKIVELS